MSRNNVRKIGGKVHYFKHRNMTKNRDFIYTRCGFLFGTSTYYNALGGWYRSLSHDWKFTIAKVNCKRCIKLFWGDK